MVAFHGESETKSIFIRLSSISNSTDIIRLTQLLGRYEALLENLVYRSDGDGCCFALVIAVPATRYIPRAFATDSLGEVASLRRPDRGKRASNSYEREWPGRGFCSGKGARSGDCMVDD